MSFIKDALALCTYIVSLPILVYVLVSTDWSDTEDENEEMWSDL